MKFTTCKEIKGITTNRNTSSFTFSSLQEHARQKRNALTVLNKKISEEETTGRSR